MNAPDLFALLQRVGPEYGVTAPDGDEEAFWGAYFRDLREFGAAAVEYAFAAWRRGEYDPKRPQLALIFPTPEQLAELARTMPEPSPLAALRPLMPIEDVMAAIEVIAADDGVVL